MITKGIFKIQFKKQHYLISCINLFTSIEGSVGKEEANVSRETIAAASSCICRLVSHYIS